MLQQKQKKKTRIIRDGESHSILYTFHTLPCTWGQTEGCWRGYHTRVKRGMGKTQVFPHLPFHSMPIPFHVLLLLFVSEPIFSTATWLARQERVLWPIRSFHFILSSKTRIQDVKEGDRMDKIE